MAAKVPERSRRNPWEIASIDLYSINEVLRQIQLAVDGLQVTEHKHTGTEASDSGKTDELQIVESAITPPILVANQNNYNPAGLTTATVIRISATTPVNITGLAAQPVGTIKKLFNYGTVDITLIDGSTLSKRGNRFDLTSNIVIGADQTISLQYDTSLNRNRWKVIGNAGGSSAAAISDHGLLTGLTDDDHTQYVLFADLEASRAVVTTNWDDLTDGGATTLHSHAGGLSGSGTAGRVAFWDGASSLSSDADFTFSVDTLSIDNVTFPATTSTEGIVRSGSSLWLHNFGTSNTFVGVGAGNLTLTGNTNTGFGKDALTALTSGVTNTGLGFSALKALTEGNSNMALGGNALLLLTTGSNNTAVGEASLQSITTVSSLTAVGHAALTGNTSGLRNTGVGESALSLTSTGSNNTAVGFECFKSITTASGVTGCGRSIASNATGASSTGVGNAALFSLSSGASNTAVGEAAGFTLTTGGSNTIIGGDADVSVNSVSNSAAIGRNTIVASSNHMVLGDSAVTIGIAGAARPTGSGGIVFPDGTALSALATNTAGLYANDVAGTVEMFAIDEGGASTQISPHNFTMFDPDPSYEYPWSYYSKHAYIGKEIGVDMWRLVRAVERLSGETILHIKTLPANQIRNWAADQQAQVDQRAVEIATWDASPPEIKAKRPRPMPLMPKQLPKWIADRIP